MAFNNGGGDRLKIEPDPATWTELEEKTFVNIMIKEVKRGKSSKSTFSRSSWAIIEQEFYEKTNRRYNHSQFRNKYNQLRIYYCCFSKLLKEPGFTWDPVLKSAVATDAIWDSYLKTNTKAKRFRKKGCPMYYELGIIFGDAVTDFKDAYPLAQYPSLSDEKIDPENESTNAPSLAFQIDSSSSGKDCPDQNLGQRRKRTPSPTPTPTSHLHRNKETKTQDESPKDAIRTEVFDKQGSEPMSQRTQTVKNFEAYPPPCSFSITNCVRCLESIQDVDASTYVKAITMFKDVDWREMFMAMSAQRRSDWLASLE